MSAIHGLHSAPVAHTPPAMGAHAPVQAAPAKVQMAHAAPAKHPGQTKSVMG